MRKTKLGIKRQCQACGGRLYDLGKRPVVCPRCGAEVDLERVKRAARTDDAEGRAGARGVARRRARAAADARRGGPPPQWSPEQAAALDKVGRWLAAGEPQVFRLFGYAGVGKTTLAKRLAESAAGETAFAAFTGKAALVMRSKGCAGASTIHALIYRASEGEDGAPTFTLNHDGPASRAALIVIDECSMVDAELGRDLLSFGKPILVLGDPAQLPPVKGGGFFTEAEPDVMLTTIHRQAQDDPIIRLSEIVRSGGEIAYGQYGESRVIRRDEIDAADVLAADQVLVGVNRTRRLYNQRIRQLQGTDGAAAGRRRQAGLPAQRPRQGPDQRRPVAGRDARGAAQGLRAHDGRVGRRSGPRRGQGRGAAGSSSKGSRPTCPTRRAANPTNSTTATP